MDIAALIAWLVTASGGFYLIGVWVRGGGVPQQRTGATRFTPPLIFGHPLLAASGLVVWIVYMLSDDSEVLAWTAFGLLVPVALLGFAMLFRWLGGRSTASSERAAEQRLALPAVLAHGVLAVTTVVVVLLAALDAGS